MKEKIKAIIKRSPRLYNLLLIVRLKLTNPKVRIASHKCVELFQSIIKVSDDEIIRIIKTLEQRNRICFVQIGSNDGKQGDPLYNFVMKSDKWHGVLVEPVNFLFERLKKNYANKSGLIFENSLISNDRKERIFYYVDSSAKKSFPDLPDWYDQLGSFNHGHILHHLGKKIEPYIKKQSLKSIKLNDLLRKYDIHGLDLLHIDVEGHDYQIIKQLDLKRMRPVMILIEHKHLSFWETFKLIKKLIRFYMLFTNGADILCVDLNFSNQVDVLNFHTTDCLGSA